MLSVACTAQYQMLGYKEMTKLAKIFKKAATTLFQALSWQWLGGGGNGNTR